MFFLKKYFLIFLISGLIITGVVLLTKYISPLLGAILYAIPFEFLIIFFSLRDTEKRKQLVKNSLISLLITLIFIIFFYVIFVYVKNILISFLISFIIYITLILIYLKRIKNDI